jgi:TPR repeat protein
MKRLVASALIAMAFATPAAADYYDGLRAYDAGEYARAAQEWRKAVNAKDTKAMYALGKLYREGIGVPQSFVKAHLYFNLAGSLGLAEARQARDEIAERMSDAERARAQRLAENWPPKSETAGAAEQDSPTPARLSPEGTWRWKIVGTPGTSCESLDFGPLTISEDKATSLARHPQDGPFPLLGNLYDDGKISMAASGRHSSLSLSGLISGDKGHGKLDVSGEVNCTGEWTVRKLK